MASQLEKRLASALYGTPYRTPSPPPGKKPRHFWKIFGWSILALFIISLLSVGGLFLYVARDLPSPTSVSTRFVAESTKIFDRTGNHVLYEIHGEEKRTIIPYTEMPEAIRAATITLEDQGFYKHYGIDPTSILRAIFKDVQFGGASQGGSTITQQFIKNSLLTNEKTMTRKVKEVILSLELEQKYSKDEILAMYLNEIPYGSNAYGVQAGAQTFFGKDAKDLTLDESALLASLPNAPSYFSPYGSHTDALKARQEKALTQMAGLGYITTDQAEAAKAVDVLAKIVPQRENINAPHFVMYVKEYLENKYGASTLEQGGMKVYTTLDWDKQRAGEEILSQNSAKNLKYKANNAALVAVDPTTGQILTMVGSKDYFGKATPEGCVSGKNCTFEGNFNVTTANRQPGSSFKPYVYLSAFTKGYLPESLLYDVETNFSTSSGKDYTPQNYSGKFNGPVSMAKALGGSLNVPAVKTLYLTGVPDAITLAKNLGVDSLNPNRDYGLSLVLGGGEVKLLDHVHAYATLATGGVKHAMTPILRVEDSKGAVLEQYQPDAGVRVVDEKYVAMLDSIISNNTNRAWIFGENNPLRFDNRPVAAKTGTTNEWRDGWTIGYTPSLAVGVWAGNNDNSIMAPGADGAYVAAPLWRAFMDKALSNVAIQDFPKYNPDDEIGDGDGKTNKPMLNGQIEKEESIKVCEIPGKDKGYCLANKYCPDNLTDKKDFISPHSILYYVDRSDPRGPAPDKPQSDSQYKEWEKAVNKWYDDNKPKHTVLDTPPTDECKESDFSSYRPSIRLNVSDTSSSELSISSDASAPYGVSTISYTVDGKDAGSTTNPSSSVKVSVADKNNASVKVEVTLKDNNGNTATDSKTVNVKFPVAP